MLSWAEAEVFKPINRCAAPDVNPATAQRDTEITKALFDAFGHMNCGIYVRVTQPRPGQPGRRTAPRLRSKRRGRPMTLTLLQAWQSAKKRLEAVGLTGPVIDARLLVEAAADATRADIVTEPHRALTPEEQEQTLADFLARREHREPASPHPRPQGFLEDHAGGQPPRAHPSPRHRDRGRRGPEGFPRSRRPGRCSTSASAPGPSCSPSSPSARRRAAWVSTSRPRPSRWRVTTPRAWGLASRVALLRGDWTAGLAEADFDLVVANPPYIPTAVIETLSPEVSRGEPRLALDGGPDGLAAYRILAGRSCGSLKPGGRFAVEIGYDQKDAVEALFRDAGAVELRTIRDLADQGPRCRECEKRLGNPRLTRYRKTVSTQSPAPGQGRPPRTNEDSRQGADASLTKSLSLKSSGRKTGNTYVFNICRADSPDPAEGQATI